ncbi:hypothetical protein CQ12_33400 [Bradyrhizobium jicamae]|uniref:Uncharacterized protein n=1 Tax=Bradyrhizobium jicamae TaxID=280332 RepID=A0A0R3LEV6_9BRAD|nr:hypothetical protein CQ12_33400 [Bradyrhizobium jicamae]
MFPAAAINEASKFDPALREFYILTTARDDGAVQAYVANLNQKREEQGLFRVIVLGWGEIMRRATSDSDVTNKHFGPTAAASARLPCNELSTDELCFLQVCILMTRGGPLCSKGGRRQFEPLGQRRANTRPRTIAKGCQIILY